MYSILRKYLIFRIFKSIFYYLIRFRFISNRKVDFLVIGAQKSGTTALYKYLELHPSIEVPVKKELHFFSNDDYFRFPKFIREIHYHRFYKRFSRKLKLGEFTPKYIAYKSSILRIKKYNPNIKLILILRDPISRAFSAWNMYKIKGWEKNHYIDVFNQELELDINSKGVKYLYRGLYYNQITFLKEHFDDKQILILFQTDLQKNPVDVLSRITKFLEIENFDHVDNIIVHNRPYEETLSPEMHNKLLKYYLSDIENLESLLSVDLSTWKKFK